MLQPDIFIAVEGTILHTLKDDEFKNSNIRIAGVMKRVHGNAYLLPKHADLAPRLSTILKEMKHQGLIEKYQNMVINERGLP